jgi:hypothetical protein
VLIEIISKFQKVTQGQLAFHLEGGRDRKHLHLTDPPLTQVGVGEDTAIDSEFFKSLATAEVTEKERRFYRIGYALQSYAFMIHAVMHLFSRPQIKKKL